MNKKEKQRICKALLSSKIKVEQMSDTLFDTLEFLKIKKPLINQEFFMDLRGIEDHLKISKKYNFQGFQPFSLNLF